MTNTFNLKISLAIDPSTQELLRELSQPVTPADLQAVADLKTRIEASRARIDLIDPLPQTQKVSIP